MKLESGKFCPLIGKDCIQLQCSWFTQVRGTHPQTGERVDEWGCAVTWLPLLLMENTKEQISTCLLYTSPSPRDRTRCRMPSSA